KSSGKSRVPVCDHGPGALLPALVNAHTHLELSCFKDKINCDNGFGPWVQELLQLRENYTPADMIAGAERGIREILATGTGAVCEISSLGLTFEIVSDSGLLGLWCREVLGNAAGSPAIEPDIERAKPADRIASSLAGHAPHTTSPELLKQLSQAAKKRKLPFSIHLSESSEEMEFIGSGRGHWADFLISRGIDFSNWDLPARSPVAYLDKLSILDKHSLAVHVLRADPADLDILQQRRTNICLCPRSNQALHGCLPDIPAMLARGLKPCLGTDSLASSPSLDLFDEMAFVASHYDSIDPVQIFAMATINGATALNLPCNGTFEPGSVPYMVYVPMNCTNEHALIECIVNKAFNEPCKPHFQGTQEK
ncbi:MAG: amidohydrolase family protein, partial [Desulfobacterales bacterium]|nr:amidohydrolase family protein [Desulfobacterales bacterium]